VGREDDLIPVANRGSNRIERFENDDIRIEVDRDVVVIRQHMFETQRLYARRQLQQVVKALIVMPIGERHRVLGGNDVDMLHPGDPRRQLVQEKNRELTAVVRRRHGAAKSKRVG
jgi:hypothetical protein